MICSLFHFTQLYTQFYFKMVANIFFHVAKLCRNVAFEYTFLQHCRGFTNACHKHLSNIVKTVSNRHIFPDIVENKKLQIIEQIFANICCKFVAILSKALSKMFITTICKCLLYCKCITKFLQRFVKYCQQNCCRFTWQKIA